MTDQTPLPPQEPGAQPPDDGPRNEQVAALLAVEPLDDMTRRRLVNTAVAAGATPDDEEGDELERRGRSRLAVLLPVAAALAVGVVVGALIVTRPDDPTTTAARQDTTVAADKAGADSTPAPQAAANPPALNESSPLQSLGDLGDVSEPGSLSQAVTAARNKDAATTPTGVCADIPPPDLGLVTTSAAGTGTAGGEAVDVILGTDVSDETIAVVLRSEDCLIIRKDVLPPG